jgi:hypothetical protein
VLSIVPEQSKCYRNVVKRNQVQSRRIKESEENHGRLLESWWRKVIPAYGRKCYPWCSAMLEVMDNNERSTLLSLLI